MRAKRLIPLGGLVLMAILLPARVGFAQSPICNDGTPSNNSLICGASPAGGDLDADLGNDKIIVKPGITVSNVQGDGLASDADPADNPPWVADPIAATPGGKDAINVRGTVTGEVSGDYLEESHGGNDKIMIAADGVATSVS